MKATLLVVSIRDVQIIYKWGLSHSRNIAKKQPSCRGLSYTKSQMDLHFTATGSWAVGRTYLLHLCSFLVFLAFRFSFFGSK